MYDKPIWKYDGYGYQVDYGDGAGFCIEGTSRNTDPYPCSEWMSQPGVHKDLKPSPWRRFLNFIGKVIRR